MALRAAGVNGPPPTPHETQTLGASEPEGPAVVPLSTRGTPASASVTRAVNVFARTAAGSAPSRIPIARIQGRIGAERWRWYADKADRQAAYSRMHIACNRKLAQMACVSNCHSIVLYFPESMHMRTWSSFGSFDAGIEIYDAIEEHMEREKEVVDVDFTSLWQQTIQREGFPLLDSLVESFRCIGVGEDALRRLSSSFRSNALRHMRGEHSMRTELARDIEHAIVNFCADLDAGRDTATVEGRAPAAETKEPTTEDDEVMDLVGGGAPPPAAPTVQASASPRATHAAAAVTAPGVLAMLQQERAAKLLQQAQLAAHRTQFEAQLRAQFASHQARSQPQAVAPAAGTPDAAAPDAAAPAPMSD